MARWLLIALMSVLATSCGGGRVTLSQPPDGHQMTLPQGGAQSFTGASFVATTDDNDYTDVTIQALGAEKVPGLTCNGGAGQPLQCVLYPSQNMQQPLMQGQTLTVVVRAQRGDWKDFRIVYFTSGQAGGTYRPPGMALEE